MAYPINEFITQASAVLGQIESDWLSNHALSPMHSMSANPVLANREVNLPKANFAGGSESASGQVGYTTKWNRYTHRQWPVHLSDSPPLTREVVEKTACARVESA